MTSKQKSSALSIGTRLTLLYTLLALSAIAFFAGISYREIATHLNSNHRRFLQAKVAEQQTDLRNGGFQASALLDEIQEETAETRPRQYMARVLDADGRILGETPNMQKRLPIALFPVADSTPLAISEIRRQVTIGDDDYDGGDRDVFNLISVRMQTADGMPKLYVQMALGVTGDDELLYNLRQAMWFTLIVLLPMLILAGRWIAISALRPLNHIAVSARDISATRLSSRIATTKPWPQELNDMVIVFNDMLARLDEAFGRLSRFSADLAHELRTPLSTMSGELEVSQLRERSPEEYRAVLASNLDECRRLNLLIDNLLFMARAERADMALRLETFAAEEACAWVVAQQSPGARVRQVRIHLEGKVDVYADQILFRQAIANVLGNAIRYSPIDSRVLISLSADDAGNATVRVIDHGVGIDTDHIPYVFDRFYQVDPSRTREFGQGTGLGLAIVKTIVELHGGTIALTSSAGHGTIVTMDFPAAKAI